MADTVEVYVADHKHIDFAVPDYCRMIQVNAELSGQWEGYLHDNDNKEDNISTKNINYAELTALYSMWKNCTADIQGLFHYRRFITHKTGTIPIIPLNVRDVDSFTITEQEIIRELEDADIILTVPVGGNEAYSINVVEAFMTLVPREYMLELYRFLEEVYPEYAPSLWHVLNADNFSCCNMFIARREVVNDYCTWLFGVLFELEERLSRESGGNPYRNSRIPGFMGEFLLNVYVHKHNLRCKFFQKAVIGDVTAKNKFNVFAKSMIKHFPFLLRLLPFVYAMNSSELIKVLNRMKSCRTHESLQKRMYSLGAERRGDFVCLSARAWEQSSMMMLLPVNESADYLPALEGLINASDREAALKGIMFAYRLVVSKKIPAPVKDRLEYAGIRVAEYC